MRRTHILVPTLARGLLFDTLTLENIVYPSDGGYVSPAAKIKNSIFGTTTFKDKPIQEQRAFISAHESELPKLSHYGLDYIATIILRSHCSCQLVQLYVDESTGEKGEYECKHDPSCHLVRLPIMEDLSESTLRRRQRREMLASPETLRMLEEESHGVDGKRYQ